MYLRYTHIQDVVYRGRVDGSDGLRFGFYRRD